MVRQEHLPAWRMTNVRTLAEVAVRTQMLDVACSCCERRGRHRPDTLNARAGGRVIVSDLVAE